LGEKPESKYRLSIIGGPGERVVQNTRNRVFEKTLEGGTKSLAIVVSQLALKFDVSEQAMEYRLKNLGLVME